MGVLRLLLGTLMLRPYVFVFLAVYLCAAVTRMGWAKTAAFSAVAWAIAYAAEFSSTRSGFPFGLYVYVDATRGRELWLSNVPFFDSLSFTFLCYLGYALAIFLYAPLVCGRGDFQVADTRAIRTSWRVLVTGAFLTTLMDLVIDPLTVRGERWFLGRISYYPEGGIHFGVPLSNYAGWFLVAAASIAAFQALERRTRWSTAGVRHVPYGGLLEPLLYLGIVVFNLVITLWIVEPLLALVGCLLYLPVVVLFVSHPLNPMRRAGSAELARHREDFLASPIVLSLGVYWRPARRRARRELHGHRSQLPRPGAHRAHPAVERQRGDGDPRARGAARRKALPGGGARAEERRVPVLALPPVVRQRRLPALEGRRVRPRGQALQERDDEPLRAHPGLRHRAGVQRHQRAVRHAHPLQDPQRALQQRRPGRHLRRGERAEGALRIRSTGDRVRTTRPRETGSGSGDSACSGPCRSLPGSRRAVPCAPVGDPRWGRS